jgi:hypothetical protein
VRSLVAIALGAACGGDKQKAPATEATPDVAAQLTEARRLAEATWPDARLAGIRIGPEVIFEERRERYAVRVMIEFASDPTDAAAKSASIVCSPDCAIHRAKVDAPTFDWPACAWPDALAAARAAGLEAAQPVAGYGNWASGPSWEVRARREDPRVIAVDGTTCEVTK